MQSNQEKAVKLKLIYDNEMHRNQSFLILIIKWMLDHYREQLKEVIATQALAPNNLRLSDCLTKQGSMNFNEVATNQSRTSYIIPRAFVNSI